MNCLPCILNIGGIVWHELLHSVELLPPKVGEVLRLVRHEAVEVSGQLLGLGEVKDVDDGVGRGYGCVGFELMSVVGNINTYGILGGLMLYKVKLHSCYIFDYRVTHHIVPSVLLT